VDENGTIKKSCKSWTMDETRSVENPVIGQWDFARFAFKKLDEFILDAFYKKFPTCLFSNA